MDNLIKKLDACWIFSNYFFFKIEKGHIFNQPINKEHTKTWCQYSS